MTLQDLLAEPYVNRQLIVFSREISNLTTLALSVYLKELWAQMDKHPVKYSFRQMIYSGVTLQVLGKLISELFKGDRQITFLPVECAKELSLPKGNLLVGELYVAHPLESQAKFYYPMSDFHQALHRQKSHELIEILRSLKVGHFSIKHVEGSKDVSGLLAKIGTQVKKVKINGSAEMEETHKEDSSIIWEETTKNISGRPTLPRNLIWYDYELDWQLAVKGLKNDPENPIHFKYQYKNDYEINRKAGMKILNHEMNIKYKHSAFQSTCWEVRIGNDA